MIISSFFSYLGADAGVAALCPASLFPHTIPQGATLPAITFSLDSEETDQLLDVVGDLRTALIETSAWDTDHAGAHALADAIEAALVDYRGAFGTKTAERISLERKFDSFESDTLLYRVSLQFLVAYY